MNGLRHSRVRVLALLSACGLLLGTSSAVAQGSRFWAEGGVGPTGSDMGWLLAVQYEPAEAAVPLSSISLRTATDLDLLGSDDFWDVGVLVGPVLRIGGGQTRRHARLAVQTGLALTGMTRSDSPLNFCWGFCDSFGPTEGPQGSDVAWMTFGVPLSVSASWQPLRFLGVGLHGFANVNRRRSFAGVVGQAQLGRVR